MTLDVSLIYLFIVSVKLRTENAIPIMEKLP